MTRIKKEERRLSNIFLNFMFYIYLLTSRSCISSDRTTLYINNNFFVLYLFKLSSTKKALVKILFLSPKRCNDLMFFFTNYKILPTKDLILNIRTTISQNYNIKYLIETNYINILSYINHKIFVKFLFVLNFSEMALLNIMLVLTKLFGILVCFFSPDETKFSS